MFFSKTKRPDPVSSVQVSGTTLEVVSSYKYLGIILDSQLSFKKQVKNVLAKVKFNLHNFRYIRNNLPPAAALQYFHSMIMPHITNCLTTWSHTHATTLLPIQSVYKQALKALDGKPRAYHHCNILPKHKLLSWENLLTFHDTCLIYKILHDLAPPPLSTFIRQKNPLNRVTRASLRGDLVPPRRRSPLAFTVKASHSWNTLPDNIRDSITYRSFARSLKTWFIQNYKCLH